MWLINWLGQRASKVLQWFGSSYSTWVSRLKSFFTHLRYYRDQAVKWAREWALPKIVSYWQDLKNRIYNAKLAAINWANNVGSNIRIWVDVKILNVKNLLGLRVSELTAEYQRMRAKIHKGDSRVETEVKTWAEVLFGRLLSPFKWILELKDLLQGLKELFTEENLKKLVTIFNSLFSFILTLATHPLETLIAIIEPIFLELLNFTLAYALGTEKYELPDWPDWSNFGGAGGGGFLPIGVKQDLNAPLKFLRVSGYTFNNPKGHMGIDLALSRGQAVYTMHDGIVEYINRAFTGYGYQIIIGGGFWWTRYAHLETINVSRGQKVGKGKQIGKGDSTGNSTGDHLHLEIKYKGAFVDPAKILF